MLLVVTFFPSVDSRLDFKATESKFSPFVGIFINFVLYYFGIQYKQLRNCNALPKLRLNCVICSNYVSRIKTDIKTGLLKVWGPGLLQPVIILMEHT